MINRKKSICNNEETGVRLYWHREAMVYFGATGRGIEHFIPGLESYYEDHMTVLEDVVIQTAFDFTEYQIFPTCPSTVEGILKLLESTSLVTPTLRVSLPFFKAAYGMK
jgi:hypothetical protein